MNFQHIKGDTFDAVPFQINFNSSPLNLTGATIRMQLRKEYQGLIYFNVALTIVNGSAGTFRINKQIINIEAWDYLYDIEIALSDGTVKTWVSGLFSISNNVTE